MKTTNKIPLILMAMASATLMIAATIKITMVVIGGDLREKPRPVIQTLPEHIVEINCLDEKGKLSEGEIDGLRVTAGDNVLNIHCEWPGGRMKIEYGDR